MATPSEIRDQLLKDLRAARTQLMSAEWLTMIREEPKAERQKAASSLMHIQLALLDLENSELATFRDALVANEAELATSTASMHEALDSLESTAAVLEAVGEFLGVFARVVALV